MTTIRKNIIIGLAVLAMGGATFGVQAHAPANGAAGSMSKEQKQAKWSERAAERQQKLRATLKLTPSQDAAFAAYIAAVKPQQRGERLGRDAWKTMPAPARMERRIAMHKARTAAMETRLAALTAFYAVLTPEQQKLFDDTGARHGRGGMGHGRSHGGHGGGHGLHG